MKKILKYCVNFAAKHRYFKLNFLKKCDFFLFQKNYKINNKNYFFTLKLNQILSLNHFLYILTFLKNCILTITWNQGPIKL